MGWKAREFDLGMNREGCPRVGMAANPVGTLTVESEAESLAIGWTVVRMCFQFVEDIAEDLYGAIIKSVSQKRIETDQ